MAPALPWLLPAFVAGLATIRLTRRWARIVTGILWGIVLTLTLLLILRLTYLRTANMTEGEDKSVLEVITLLD